MSKTSRKRWRGNPNGRLRCGGAVGPRAIAAPPRAGHEVVRAPLALRWRSGFRRSPMIHPNHNLQARDLETAHPDPDAGERMGANPNFDPFARCNRSLCLISTGSGRNEERGVAAIPDWRRIRLHPGGWRRSPARGCRRSDAPPFGPTSRAKGAGIAGTVIRFGAHPGRYDSRAARILGHTHPGPPRAGAASSWLERTLHPGSPNRTSGSRRGCSKKRQISAETHAKSVRQPIFPVARRSLGTSEGRLPFQHSCARFWVFHVFMCTDAR